MATVASQISACLFSSQTITKVANKPPIQKTKITQQDNQTGTRLWE